MTRTTFLWIGRAEGLSLLVLFGVAMPLKYVAGDERAVEVVGWLHGLLFIAYVAAAAWSARVEGWPAARLLLAWFSSVLPFGTFLFERSLPEPDAAV